MSNPTENREIILKDKIEEYSEAELTELLNEFFENPSRLKGDALGAHINFSQNR